MFLSANVVLKVGPEGELCVGLKVATKHYFNIFCLVLFYAGTHGSNFC
jgi:hypothetical protein